MVTIACGGRWRVVSLSTALAAGVALSGQARAQGNPRTDRPDPFGASRSGGAGEKPASPPASSLHRFHQYAFPGGDAEKQARLEKSLETWTQSQARGGADGANAFWYTAIRDPADEALGATLEAADAPLRNQLKLPDDHGLVVTNLAPDGPAASAGLKVNDVLLTLAGKPLSEPTDLVKRLEEAGRGPAPLALVRDGKPLTLRVRPVYHVTLAPAEEAKTEYHLGVAVKLADAALRAHLHLNPGTGLAVTQIAPGSPAEKAGVKVGDVLTRLDRQPVTNPEGLVNTVRRSQGKPLPLTLYRAGEERAVDITPEPRKPEPDTHRGAVRVWTLRHQAHPGVFPGPNYGGQFPVMPSPNAGSDPTAKRLDDLDKELKELRRTLEEVRDALKKGPGR